MLTNRHFFNFPTYDEKSVLREEKRRSKLSKVKTVRNLINYFNDIKSDSIFNQLVCSTLPSPH